MCATATWGNHSKGLGVAASESVKDLKLLEIERGGGVVTTGTVCCWNTSKESRPCCWVWHCPGGVHSVTSADFNTTVKWGEETTFHGSILCGHYYLLSFFKIKSCGLAFLPSANLICEGWVSRSPLKAWNQEQHSTLFPRFLSYTCMLTTKLNSLIDTIRY